ncbi:MAG: ADP-ribosylation factor-like protein [Gemmatimonadota bacterium]
MATINTSRNEIDCKIVYCGPFRSGKTTNLRHVHHVLEPGTRGPLIAPAGDSDRTIFFDFLAVELGDLAGMHARVQLLAAPGRAGSLEARRRVLAGADGVVFVADSAPDRLDDNTVSLAELQDNLAMLGRSDVPVVLQYNKRDLPDATAVETLDKALNSERVPTFEAIAIQGDGVIDSLVSVSRAVVASFA